MKYLSTILFFAAFAVSAEAQHSLRAYILGGAEKVPLPGATLSWKETRPATQSDSSGLATLSGIADGRQAFLISYTGYEEKTIELTFPLSDTGILEIVLEEEVIVTATRISRTIANIPTRVEVISGEELAEKANMKPGDIRRLLNESTGIQTQQTPATSFKAGIRPAGAG